MKISVRNIFLFCLALYAQVIAAQSFAEPSEGGQFLKRTEYNFLAGGSYNLKSKTDVEKLLFGDFNARVEFFVQPSFEGAYGFRIVQDSLDNYLLEAVRISNWEKVEKELEADFPSKGIPVERLSTLSEKEIDANTKYNREVHVKRNEARLKRYETDSRRLPVNQKFVEKLYSTVSKAIDNFKGKGVMPMITDGYSVTFRCIVEDEVWTLTVHMPGGYIGKLTGICEQIIKDAETNEPDESLQWSNDSGTVNFLE